jgi:glycosyltransferase involved in cell wall biosynthesis
MNIKSSISVIIPNFNHGHYLDDCLEELLNQSHKPDEIIVVDDASTDNSRDVLKKIATRHPEVILVNNSKNIGPLGSVNKALTIVKGEYICFQSADDLVMPGFFEKTIAVLNQNIAVAQCVAIPGFFSDKNTQIYSHVDSLPLGESPIYIDPKQYIQLQRYKYFNLWGHSSVFRRSVFLGEDGFDANLKWHADWFIYNVLALKYGICYIPEVLAAFRISDNSYSNAGIRNTEEQNLILCKMMDKLLEKHGSDILNKFIDSNLFSVYGEDIINIIKYNDKYRLFYNEYIDKVVKINKFKYRLKAFIPNRLKMPLKRILKKIRYQY